MFLYIFPIFSGDFEQRGHSTTEGEPQLFISKWRQATEMIRHNRIYIRVIIRVIIRVYTGYYTVNTGYYTGYSTGYSCISIL